MQNTFLNMISQIDMPTLTLEEATKVRLMSRVDKKFWFRFSELENLLNAIKDDYYIQTVNGKKWQQYATQYFDTVDNKMYTLHHNGKLNRYKIRKRDYLDTGDHFLEVKFKTNQGRTIKKRIESTVEANDFNQNESTFIEKRSIFHDNELGITLKNTFYRVTFINKNFTERCTVDIELDFESNQRNVHLDGLVILEVKSEKGQELSPVTRYLRDRRIMASGFSKYCVGRALTDNSLKRNRLKQKIRDIGKVIDMPDLYYM